MGAHLKKEVLQLDNRHRPRRHHDRLAFILQPPLIHAILAGNLDEVQEILDSSPDAASVLDSEKRSPLHAAAFAGYADIADLLITKGSARVNTKDNQWLTPLHRACRSSAEVIMSLCIIFIA